MIGSILNFIFWLKGKLLFVGLLFIVLSFFYSFISLRFEVLFYHAVMWPFFITNTMGWTNGQLFMLVFLLFFPDILKIIKKILYKII